MSFKQNIHAATLAALNQKIASLQEMLRELTEGIAGDTKSTAGDKHETARAMAQLEQEKIGKQLGEAEQQKATLEKFPGTLVKTNRGWLFLSVALGKITVDGETVMVISPQSPLGAQLAGKSVGESVAINGTTYTIESVDAG